MERMGYGEGYEYPHDDPRGWRPQQYRPEESAGSVYYEPSPHGSEQEIHDRWLRTRNRPLPPAAPHEEPEA